MKNFFKKNAKKFIRSIGYELHKYVPDRSPTAQLIVSFENFNIDLILDVGANVGQFSQDMRGGGYSGKIISFEPLSDAHAKLLWTSKNDSNWDVYSRCAIGGSIGEVAINIAANSASSSVLPMLESHIDAAPHTAYVGTEMVPLLTIDSIASNFVNGYKNIFIKIDTQGFEWEVLNGCSETLPNIKGILVEMSLIPLYGGQHLWDEIVVRLKDAGFSLWAVQPGFTNSTSGRTLQFDGIFFREN